MARPGLGPAFRSGMRGGEEPSERFKADSEAAASRPGESTEDQDYGEIVKQHIHGPDENGHHHLNLTTLAEHLHGKRAAGGR